MPKFRSYTGLLRTPPSMAWLIRERARLKGLIERRQRQLEEIPREILELQTILDSMDRIIPLHEVKVDPKVIKGTKPKKKALLPYGVLTKMIFRCLREAAGKPLFTSEITLELMREAKIPVSHDNKAYVMGRVSHRLKALAQEGRVEKHHKVEVGSRDEGSWSLPQQGWAQDDEEDQASWPKAA